MASAQKNKVGALVRTGFFHQSGTNIGYTGWFCWYNYPRLVLLAYNYEQVGSAGKMIQGWLCWHIIINMVGSAGLVDPQDDSAGKIIKGWFCWHIIMNKMVLLAQLSKAGSAGI